MSIYRIVSQDSHDESVDWYGAGVGDLVEIADDTPCVWLKGSKVFDKEWQGYEVLCVADTIEDLLKYVEKVE